VTAAPARAAADGGEIVGGLVGALAQIADQAAVRDGAELPAFPFDAFDALQAAGGFAPAIVAGEQRPPAAWELWFVRQVARADASVARIVDGHLNAIERVAVHAATPLRDRELAAFAAGTLRAGVWGGEPRPGEGAPAAVTKVGGRLVLRGTKTYCSGAGGLQRALVLAADGRVGTPAPGDAPLAAWVDLCGAGEVQLDESWYAGHGMRGSASHRVVFHDAPVLGLLGPPGSLIRQPWFARDALRTAASWAGAADVAVETALGLLAAAEPGVLDGLAAGRLRVAQRTIDLWLDRAAVEMDEQRPAPLAETSVHAREAIAGCCRTILDHCARACGSWPFATGSALDRARRDLEVFLLQHRLDPLVAQVGANALRGRSRR
jgi:alkylation response protein AidB-like acyl-CoA dehydrogenase